MRALVFFLVMTLTASAAAAGRLVAPEAVCVPSGAQVITLAHLARAEGEDAMAFLERWGQTSVAPAPQIVGGRVRISGRAVRQAVAGRVPVPAPPMAFPDEILVQRGGQVVALERLRPALEQALGAHLAALGGEARITQWRLPQWFFIAADEPVRFRLVPPTVLSGSIPVRVEAVDEAGVVRDTLSGVVQAEVWAEVPCAARPLSRGEVVDAQNVVRMRMDLAALGRPVWDGTGMGAVRVRAFVPQGRPIMAEMVEPVPVVERGRMVRVIFDNGRVRLAASGQSLEDGGVGSVIRVRNLQSRRVVEARVVDASTVRVGGI
ncbi:MAG: flagellar basal body P-ring formation protein FlgA [Desulfomicrobiaceae bacterium]|nr:flagellar basal body P-ring formation protein FlgA [Desulfomicrobiaceae bacterium]